MNVDQVIEKAGGVVVLARALGIHPSAVSKWRPGGQVPTERVAEVARVTGIPAAKLRPDLAAIFREDASRPATRVQSAL